MDRLSDPILTKAISFLTTRDAIRLALVAQRFMHAAVHKWRQRPVLVKIDSSEQINVSIIDPFLQRRCSLPPVRKSMLSARSVAIFNRHLIVVCVCADRSNVIYQFQPKSQSWRRMVVIPSQISHVIACMPLNNEELCIVGPESMLIYSRKLGVWRKCGRMPQLHINGAAGRIHQTIAVCGGCCVYDDEEGEPSPPTANVDKYDLVRNEWKQADDAPIQCESMAFTVWENRLVIAGGYTDVDLDSLSDQVYVYNQDSWKCIRSISPSQTLALFTLERCLFAYRGDDRFSRYVEDTDRWENADHQFSSGSDKTRDLGKILIIAIEAALIGDIQSGNNRDPQRWNRRLRKR